MQYESYYRKCLLSYWYKNIVILKNKREMCEVNGTSYFRSKRKINSMHATVVCPLQSSAINSTRYHCRTFLWKAKCVETVLRIRHLLWCVFVAVKECVEHNILALGTICCHLCRTIAPPAFEWTVAIVTAASKRNHYKLNMNWIVYWLLKSSM